MALRGALCGPADERVVLHYPLQPGDLGAIGTDDRRPYRAFYLGVDGHVWASKDSENDRAIAPAIRAITGTEILINGGADAILVNGGTGVIAAAKPAAARTARQDPSRSVLLLPEEDGRVVTFSASLLGLLGFGVLVEGWGGHERTRVRPAVISAVSSLEAGITPIHGGGLFCHFLRLFFQDGPA